MIHARASHFQAVSSSFRPVQSGLHRYWPVRADTGPVQASSLLFQAGIRPIRKIIRYFGSTLNAYSLLSQKWWVPS